MKVSKLFFLICILATDILTTHAALAQNNNNDRPPNEPPYTNIENEFDNSEGMINLNDQDRSQLVPPPPLNSQPSSAAPSSSALTKPVSSSPSKSPETTKTEKTVEKDAEFIKHPNAKKGLYLIDKDGVYHYKTEKISEQNQSLSVKIGSLPVPEIKGTLDNGSEFSFGDMYGNSNLIQTQIDYEFRFFKNYKQLFAQFGLGFFTATGSGYFKAGDSNATPKEKYTIIGLPVSLGATYRFEFTNRQWIAPYLSGGGLYYSFVEMRDDGKKTKAVGTPGGYGAAGALLNITAWDKELQFKMNSEYGIKNIWINIEFKYIKTSNEDLDVSNSYLAAGVTVDY